MKRARGEAERAVKQPVKAGARAGSGAVRRVPLFVAAGAVAGFAAVIGLHGRPASPAAPPRSVSSGTGTGGPGTGSSTGSGTGGGTRQAGGGTRTAVGSSVNFGYGTIAVKVTVSGKRIIRVSVASITTLEPTSQSISDQAIPVLRSEVLSAQSARINGVSGASYTSAGYAQSLQAALDALHIR